MNEYLKNLKRIEYIITLACTGKCKHCSEGDHKHTSEHIDAEIAVDLLKKVCSNYNITSIMSFGGEPLIFSDTVCAITKAASDLNIEKRQVITNGYFSRDPKIIEETVRKLADSKVNNLLLSVDAFHQETIPLEPVKFFAECAEKYGIYIRLNPAWLVSRESQNKYNIRTNEIIKEFEPLHVPTASGNVITPRGNALIYLKDFFDENTYTASPYDENPLDVKAISLMPNGDVLNGNVYKEDILDILNNYNPY